jgi:hypothetical protein
MIIKLQENADNMRLTGLKWKTDLVFEERMPQAVEKKINVSLAIRALIT